MIGADAFAPLRHKTPRITNFVMAGLVPAIHVFFARLHQDVDARVKPAHDGPFVHSWVCRHDDKPHSIPYFTPGPPLQFFGAAVGLQILWIIGVSLLLVFLLGLLYGRTSFGRAMRACAINPDVARILGIKVERMVAAGFMLSAALGAIGGILITPTQYTAFNIGVPFAVSGFIAAIIGGLGNPLGAFIGGIALGVLQAVGVVFIDAGYKNVVAFSILLLLLFLRPQGLFKALVH